MKVVWYARGGGVARKGPYQTQVDAAASLFGLDGNPVDGSFVWPEEAEYDSDD